MGQHIVLTTGDLLQRAKPSFAKAPPLTAGKQYRFNTINCKVHSKLMPVWIMSKMAAISVANVSVELHSGSNVTVPSAGARCTRCFEVGMRGEFFVT